MAADPKLRGVSPHIEQVGIERVPGPVARALTIGFAISVLLVTGWDLAFGGMDAITRHARAAAVNFAAKINEGGATSPGAWNRANAQLLSEIAAFEDAIEESSPMAKAGRRWLTPVIFGDLRGEVAQVVAGRDGWLFYGPDLDYVIGRPTFIRGRLRRQMLSAVTDFAADLAEQGIGLILVPTPVKPVVEPGQVNDGLPSGAAPLQNAGFEIWMADLGDAFKRVWSERGLDPSLLPKQLDPAPGLAARRAETGQPQFLKTDTHWTPSAMEWVAHRVANEATESGWLPPTPPVDYTTQPDSVAGIGETALLLDVKNDSPWRTPQDVRIQQVLDPDGTPWQPDREAEILVLGDSFSNIFSLDAMGWGHSAGFAEHLSAALQRPVDAIRRNDGGASATRQALSDDLARGLDRLANKRVVVWQFAVRELAFGNWLETPLVLGPTRDSKFLALTAGEALTVTASIEEIGELPRPAGTPYADFLTAFHLRGVHDPAGRPVGDAIVYLQTMKNRQILPPAKLRIGDAVTIKLQPWQDVESELGALNRGELDSLDLLLEEPNWGTLIR